MTSFLLKALIKAMRGKLKQHWKFTTFLFAVGIIELCIVGLYLSIQFVQPTGSPRVQPSSNAVFGIATPDLSPIELKQPAFGDLFTEGSDIDKRLPKLLHDYFKETQAASFSPAELTGLLNFESKLVRQFTLRNDAVVLHVNPHNLSSDEAIQSVSIAKTLLPELKEIYKDIGTTVRASKPHFAITAQPKPGNSIDVNTKMIALTFDDGPDGSTHELLDALAKYQASATFFVLGQKVAGGAGVLQRMVREGHEIGNHSWSHPDFRRLSPQQVNAQIADTQNAVKSATGVTPSQMRPPYGAINPAVQYSIASQGLKEAMWTVDTNDWRDKDPELLYQRIMTSAYDGGIVLLHDIHAASVQATIRAIPDLKAQGYQLVTLSQRDLYR